MQPLTMVTSLAEGCFPNIRHAACARGAQGTSCDPRTTSDWTAVLMGLLGVVLLPVWG